MRIALIVIAVIVALGVLVTLFGYTLPVKHTAARERVIAAPIEAVFSAISTPTEFPRWRSGLKSVELLPDVGGKSGFREVGGDGTISFAIDTLEPPRRMVTRIADKSLPFGGQWTHELSTDGSGTRIRITEDGEVYNPLFRVVSRYVFGHHRSIDTYLTDLETHLTARK